MKQAYTQSRGWLFIRTSLMELITETDLSENKRFYYLHSLTVPIGMQNGI